MWLHDQGYQFVGPTNMYKLTIPEMRQLYHGFTLRKRLARDEQKNISPGDRQGLKEFNQKLGE